MDELRNIRSGTETQVPLARAVDTEAIDAATAAAATFRLQFAMVNTSK
jgi:hypothetical protein